MSGSSCCGGGQAGSCFCGVTPEQFTDARAKSDAYAAKIKSAATQVSVPVSDAGDVLPPAVVEQDELIARLVRKHKAAVAEAACCKAGECKTWEEVLEGEEGVILGYNEAVTVTMDGMGVPTLVEEIGESDE